MKRRRRDTVRVSLIFVAAAVMLGHCWWFRDFLVDDAAISFSYARNLAAGHGLVLAANFERVEGYSNFAWVLMLASGARFGFDLFVWAHLLGALSALATVVGAAALSAALRGRPSALDAVPALFAALLLPVPYWAMSGLEGGLYTALVIWCAVALAAEGANPQRQWPISAWLAAAIALTRPDGLAIWGGAAFLFWRQSHSWRVRLRWLVIALVPVVAHLLWRRHYYAFWLPNTFYAKTQAPFTWSQLFDWNAHGWRYVLALSTRYRLAVLLLPALLTLVPWSASRVSRAVMLLALCILVFPLYAGGDWMSEGRFLVAALPLLCVLACTGVERVAQRWRWKRLLMGGWQLATAFVIVPNALGHSLSRSHDYPVPVESVAVRGRLYRSLAAGYAVQHPSALDGDLGGTSFYAQMPIVDMGMLGDVTFARAKGDRELLREYVHNERQPTFMMQVGFWRSLGLQQSPEFVDRYVPIPGTEGLFVDRRIFLESVMDSRTSVAAFPDAGLDLLASNVTDDIALWFLVRATPVRLPQMRSQAGAAWPVAHPILSSKDWRPGDIVKVRLPGTVGPELRLCSEVSCTPLQRGFVGAAPFMATPSASALSLAVSRKDWEVALEVATARNDSTTSIAQELFLRAEMEEQVGDTRRAFRDYALALRGNPALAMARRRVEELRRSPRARFDGALGAEYEAAKRRFVLAPNPETFSRVVVLGRATGRYEPARLHLATGIRPEDDEAALDLAELLAMSGWPEESIKVLPLTRPGTLAHARSTMVRARAGISDPAPHRDSSEQEIAAGLVVVGAWAQGTVDARSQTQVTFALRKTTSRNPVLDIDGRGSRFDRPPDSWSANELYLHEVHLHLPKSGPIQVTVNGHQISVSRD